MLSNKIIQNEKITLVEGNKIIKSDKETAKVLNNFFSKIIQNLSMLISDYICDPVTRAIVKHRTHPNNTAIMENFTSGKPFRFRLQERPLRKKHFERYYKFTNK